MATDDTTQPNKRYTLLKKLASGGMGSVWLATDEQLGRSVAYKVIDTGEANKQEALRRFRREASALAQLRSTHIVEVYDFGIHDGQPFMVMELLTGISLQRKLRVDGPLSFEEAYEIVVQVSLGLKTAHATGLVHRDLKPSNIFITERDGRSMVKLIDFGVAKETGKAGTGEDTATGVLLGTPQYMSPEQVRGSKDVDQRSDLWSLAVVLYRLLTGVSPFSGASVGDIALRICSDALPDIRQHLRGTPDSLSAFFNKAFQRNPDNRFQDVREFIAALGPAMGCEESLSNSGVRLGALGSAPQQSPPSSANPTRVSGPGRVDDSMDAIAPGTNVSVAETSWLSESGELTPPSSTVAGTLMTTGNQGARSQPQARVVALLGALAICLIGSVVVLTQGSSDVPAPATAKPGSDVVETSSSAAPDEANRTTPVASASAEPKPAKEEKETKPTKQRTLEQPRAKTKQSTVRKPARRRTTPRRQLPKQPSPAPQKRDKSKVRWF